MLGHEFPDKPAEFPSDGDDDLLFVFATCFEPNVAFMEAILHAPGECFDFIGLARLTFTERSTDLGGFAVVLGTFDEHPSGVAVSTFGDGALPSLGPAAVFPRNESKEGHELPRVVESSKVTKLAHDSHGSDFLESFTGHECLDGRLPFPGFQDGLHLFFESFDAFDAAVDGLEVFFQDNLVGLIREREFTEVAHVRVCPFGFARIVKTVAKEEGVESLFGTGEIVTRICSGSTDITDGFVESRRNPNLSNVAIAEEFGDLDGIAFVGLDLIVRSAFGLGRGHDDTIDVELSEATSEDEAGGACFIADDEVLKAAIQLLSEGAESAFNGGIAAATGTVIDGILARTRRSVGDSD